MFFNIKYLLCLLRIDVNNQSMLGKGIHSLSIAGQTLIAGGTISVLESETDLVKVLSLLVQLLGLVAVFWKKKKKASDSEENEN